MAILIGNLIFIIVTIALALTLPLALRRTKLVSEGATALLQGALLAYATIVGIILPVSGWIANYIF